MRQSTLLFVLILACSAPESPSESLDSQTGEQGEKAGQSADAGKWDELARTLSGAPGPASLSPAVERHRALMKDFWEQVRRENMEPIARWRASQLPESARGRNVLYPLSGADFLNAYAFFPDARDYVMIALEPPGTAPNLSAMNEAQINAGLTSVRNAIWTLARTNYLQSRIMKMEFDNPYIGGTLPAFLIMLGGLGHTVHSVEFVSILPDGTLGPAEKAPTKGTRIRFTDKNDGKRKTLTYLSMRLEASTASAQSGEGKFLRKLGPRNMLLKSAVYILHWESMKPVHDLLLEQSALVIQDDSGIPYKSFRAGWQERLYGTYVRALPVGGIPDPPQQPDLAAAYKKQSLELPFAYGYGILRGKGQSNLMLFWR